VNKREAENILKKVLPVVTGTNATVSKSFRKYLSNTPVKHEIKQIQGTAVLSTAHILLDVLTYVRKITKPSAWEITLHVP
jgi:hypothetical protein